MCAGTQDPISDDIQPHKTAFSQSRRHSVRADDIQTEQMRADDIQSEQTTVNQSKRHSVSTDEVSENK